MGTTAASFERMLRANRDGGSIPCVQAFFFLSRRGAAVIQFAFSLALLMAGCGPVCAANFTRDAETAVKFGVHEIRLEAGAVPDSLNPFDAEIAVTFTGPADVPLTVNAFYDGGTKWAARVYVNAVGTWQWKLETKARLAFARTRGEFTARDSALRGRLLTHPKNPAHWMTEDGRWFLNLNDTAYFLFAPRDTRGQPITDDTFKSYVRDAHAQGITSLRSFLTWGDAATWNDDQVWTDSYFASPEDGRLHTGNFARTDQRLEWLLNDFPELYLQLIMVPRGARYGTDETHWHAFSDATKNRVLRHIVARYAAFPQVFWLAVNDTHYGEKFPRNEALAREIGLFLQRHDPWQHPYSTGPARMIEVPFAQEPWLTYLHLERRWDLGAQAIERYRDAKKPVFLGEDYYEQDRLANSPAHMDYFQRRLFWSWLLSGGSANYGGRWSTLHPYRSTATQPYVPNWKNEPTFTQGLRGLDSVPHIGRYFAERKIELSDFAPDRALIADASRFSAAAAPKVMRREDREFLLYHPNAASDGKSAAAKTETPAEMKLDLRNLRGTYAIEWFDPAGGRKFAGDAIQTGAEVALRAPWAGGDAVLWLKAIGLATATTSEAASKKPAPPYPPSPVVARVEFDFATHRRLAPGSDNWPLTWADDGHLYAAWGDGGGFGGTNSSGRVLLGVARIEGDAANYAGKNVWGGFKPEHPAQFGGKSYGIISVGGVLYMWVAPQPNPHLADCRIAFSKNHGATWEFAGWKFEFGDGLTIPTFLNFGRDYAGARDDYVYSYYIEPQWGPGVAKRTTAHTFDVHRPGRLHLSRVPKNAILQRAGYEFFAGLDPATRQPRWSRDLAGKQPVFADANGVGWNLSVTYNAGLRRYLLTTEHGESHAGKFGLFDAPEPWGPWTTIAYDEAWGDGHVEVSTFYWVFTSKWMSTDGTQFTLGFTGKNSNDSWNTVGGHFVLKR